MTKLVNEHDAARALGLSVRTIQKWRVSGAGPPFRKLGAAVRYDVDDLEAFLAARRRISTSDNGDRETSGEAA